MATRQKALLAYRNALRATQIAFQVLAAARAEIKKGYYQPETKSVEERIQHLEDVSKFLLSNIVQGKKTESGKYHLNIHKYTELGDNETIKSPRKPTMVAGNGGCCGGGQRV
ncbi:Mitochondrial zinc maintenance protein 1, mitochondrial [Cyberlindnera fabianii]|uniref:Mitochondrial zinc maintenance protein 1, mitochondrial n=1 Tax=Cyberlindnera fabianii TaxID=36022 RepID=A0A1V2LCZ2_CYBFA|nr:Mitochondrial zinc maintenance protein 1, mitochondrial [Cyberlindnera fabianii]